MTKIQALARHLKCEDWKITNEDGESSFTIDNKEYLVLTDAEANEKAHEYILDSLWAFHAPFLASHCELDQDVIESIQAHDKCEDNNPVFKKLINDLDHFVSDAIGADGRAHFLNTYDGKEHEAGDFYMYRTN